MVTAVALCTQAQRLAALHKTLKNWYREHKQPSQLDHLTEEMIFRNQKVKLRAKAAEARYLLPFCVFVANKLQHLNEHWMTAACMFQYGYQMQLLVSGATEWNAEQAAETWKYPTVTFAK